MNVEILCRKAKMIRNISDFLLDDIGKQTIGKYFICMGRVMKISKVSFSRTGSVMFTIDDPITNTFAGSVGFASVNKFYDTLEECVRENYEHYTTNQED